MTTIAISDGVVVCDTQLTGGNYAVRGQKMVRLPDGGVAVGCGEWRNAWAGLKWLAGGEVGDSPELEGACVIIVRPDGAIWIAESQFPAYPILETEYAAGCGQDLARQLMAQGKSPLEAVAEACELDAMSSGPLMMMEVCRPEPMPGPTLHELRKVKARRGR